MTEENPWKPLSSDDATKWREHLDSEANMAQILESPFTSQELLAEMLSDSTVQDSRYLDSALSNPNISDAQVAWLDEKYSTRDEILSYWNRRYFGPNKDRLVFEREYFTASFSQAILSGEMDKESACKEIFELSAELMQELWHDLYLQDKIDFNYTPDHVSGDELELYSGYPSLERDVGYLLNSLGLPVINVESWLSIETYLDWGVTVERLTEDFENSREDLLESDLEDFSILAQVLGHGLDNEDLIVSDETFQEYLIDYLPDTSLSARFEIRSDVDWDGLRYAELNSTQQTALARNLSQALGHSLLGPNIVPHILVCMAIHSGTQTETIDYLKTLDNHEVTTALGERD
jgi:hypothetical protein